MNLFALEHHVESKLAEARAASARAALAAAARPERAQRSWVAHLISSLRAVSSGSTQRSPLPEGERGG